MWKRPLIGLFSYIYCVFKNNCNNFVTKVHLPLKFFKKMPIYILRTEEYNIRKGQKGYVEKDYNPIK